MANLEHLLRASHTLAVALSRWQAAPEDDLLRDGLIQRFEYSYELAWKAIQRHMIALKGRVDILPLSKKDLFRVAAQGGLITDPLAWFQFHEARNLAAHVYDDAIVLSKVLPHIPTFKLALDSLLQRLEESQ
jgi:nucleotidyltransferase substrate binding protein (TIGR01987 family)